MPLLKSSLILHVGADALHWREVAQVTVLGKSGGKSALRPIEELWEWQLVFWLLRADQCGGGPSLHQLLAEVAHLVGLVLSRDILLIIDLIDQVRLLRVLVLKKTSH